MAAPLGGPPLVYAATMRPRPPEHDFGQDDDPPDEELLELAEKYADTPEKVEALERAKARRGSE